MKIYYFTIIAVGLMFLLNLFGIDTTSNQIIDFVGGNSPEEWESSNLWVYLLVAIVGLVGLKIINLGTFSIQTSTDAIIASFISFIYVVFASDLYSILTFTSGLTGGTGWVYYTIWALIIPTMAGYTIALLEFIRGND